MRKQFCIVYMLCLAALFSCNVSDVKKPLEGKWQAINPQGNESEKYLSDEIEFFRDRTVVLSDFPGKKLPYKSELSAAEKELIKKNYPELYGKNILLIILDPSQKDWMRNAAVFQYDVTGNELSLRPAIDEKPTKFRRVTSGSRQ
jgi:hypothetical protein